MPTPIKRGELASMVPHLRGKMRKWAELSSAGSPGTTVYADSAMLKRCRAAQQKKQDSKPTTSSDIGIYANLQRQPGTILESIAELDGLEEASPDAGA